MAIYATDGQLIERQSRTFKVFLFGLANDFVTDLLECVEVCAIIIVAISHKTLDAIECAQLSSTHFDGSKITGRQST